VVVPTPAVLTNTAPLTAPIPPAARPDYRLGYVDRDDRCGVVTEIVRLILTQNFGLTAESVAFSSTDDLFATLAATDINNRVDLTACYTDPTDRSYLQKHFGFIILVGGAHRQADGKSYLLLSNAAVKKVIQRDQPCIYNLLTSFSVQNEEILSQDATTWYASHTDQIASWSQCP